MDFFKKKMKEFLDDDKPKDKTESHGPSHQTRDLGDHGQSQSYYNQSNQGGPPPQHGYGGPPQSGPQLPPGWTQQWDHNSQRYYYLEQATGRSQWEPPAFSHGPTSGPPPPGGYGQGYGQAYPTQHGGEQDRGMFGNSGHGGSGDYDAHGGSYRQEKDKDKNSALKYGLGGAAVGALGGAVIAHEMTEDSDDEGRHVTQTNTYAAAPHAGASDPYATMPPPAPTHDEDGDSMSSSDKSEIEERREELQESQEDYNEAVEEEYDS